MIQGSASKNGTGFGSYILELKINADGTYSILKGGTQTISPGGWDTVVNCSLSTISIN